MIWLQVFTRIGPRAMNRHICDLSNPTTGNLPLRAWRLCWPINRYWRRGCGFWACTHLMRCGKLLRIAGARRRVTATVNARRQRLEDEGHGAERTVWAAGGAGPNEAHGTRSLPTHPAASWPS